MKKRIIPIFVPHRGCPHDCIFCNQKKITGVSTEVTAQDARNIIEECLETIDKDTNVEIAFFGGSFTAIEEECQNELLAVAKEYVDMGLVHEIRMSTRPDCISDSILERLKKYDASISATENNAVFDPSSKNIYTCTTTAKITYPQRFKYKDIHNNQGTNAYGIQLII